MGKDMDRDLVEKITDLIDSCTTLLETITDNVFTYRMIEQPTNQEAAVGETVSFTVKATGVKEYLWQYRPTSTASWREMFSAATGGDTDTVSFESSSARSYYDYSCKLTGYDGTVRRTNVVKLIIPT